MKKILGLAHIFALTLLTFPVAAAEPDGKAPAAGQPDVVPLIGPVSMDTDLRDLPFEPATMEADEQRLTRYPAFQGTDAQDAIRAVRRVAQAVTMPAPLATFAGINSAQSGCGCLPPDTHGDVGPNHYIQSVNSSIKIIDKAGNQLLAPTTYNSFFSGLASSGTPCGLNQNQGDGLVLYDHLADRWVVSDFAFPAFPGVSFYQCIGVSKTSDPGLGRLVALRGPDRPGEPVTLRRLREDRAVAERLLPDGESLQQQHHL